MTGKQRRNKKQVKAVKFNSTWVAILVLVGAGSIIAAYQLGQKGAKEVRQLETDPAPQRTAEPAKEVVPASSPHAKKVGGAPRFAHFRVGNRNVKSMYADGRYIWVGTSGGVVRYDTETDDYELFNNKNSELLSNGIFHVSRVGQYIAIGTYGGGLSLYDPEAKTWANMNIPQGLADQFVYDVLTMPNGDVWLATWSGANRVVGGDFFNAEAWETYTVENTNGGLPNPWVYNIAAGVDGDVWFATEGGLGHFKDGKWTHWQHEDGLGAPYEVVKEAIKFRNDPAKSSMHHARQKDEQGLSNVNVAYNPNYVISLAVQKDGTVWCGTWGAGLARFDGKHWRNFTTADGLPANHVFMLYTDSRDRLWIGTNQGLALFDEKTEKFEVKTVADGLYADNVFSMADGPDGSLWIGSFGGVAHIEPGW